MGCKNKYKTSKERLGAIPYKGDGSDPCTVYCRFKMPLNKTESELTKLWTPNWKHWLGFESLQVLNPETRMLQHGHYYSPDLTEMHVIETFATGYGALLAWVETLVSSFMTGEREPGGFPAIPDPSNFIIFCGLNKETWDRYGGKYLSAPECPYNYLIPTSPGQEPKSLISYCSSAPTSQEGVISGYYSTTLKNCYSSKPIYKARGIEAPDGSEWNPPVKIVNDAIKNKKKLEAYYPTQDGTKPRIYPIRVHKPKCLSESCARRERRRKRRNSKQC